MSADWRAWIWWESEFGLDKTVPSVKLGEKYASLENRVEHIVTIAQLFTDDKVLRVELRREGLEGDLVLLFYGRLYACAVWAAEMGIKYA